MYYVIANWKMNPIELRQAQDLFEGIKKHASKQKHTRVVICPTSLHLNPLVSSYSGKKVTFGAQNLFYEKEGAHTGEVSGYQVKNAGADYCIVGHSERRARGEEDVDIKKKIEAALKADLTPIVCFGEKTRDDEGKYLSFIEKQLEEDLMTLLSDEVKDIILAYEPIWAIGGNETDAMNAHEMHQMVLYIRKILSKMFGETPAGKVPILYGGSVKSTNAGELIREGHINGFLVGGASLNVKHFNLILDEVEDHGKRQSS